jgi:hypothetical protein
MIGSSVSKNIQRKNSILKTYRVNPMQQILMTYKSAVEYVDMEEEMFERYIAPHVTIIKFDDEVFYLTDQIDEAIYFLIEESPIAKDFKLHLVD